MSAYSYYGQSGHGPNQYPPEPHGQALTTPDPYAPYSQTTYSHAPYSQPAYSQSAYSQPSLASDSDPLPLGAKRNEADQYPEQIPLQHSNSHTRMQQPTQYPPPGFQSEVEPEGQGRKKRRFFRKKIAWVTYFLSTVQIAVFIAELVKNGKYDKTVLT